MYCEVIAESFGYLKKAKDGQKEMDDLLEVVKKREWNAGLKVGEKIGIQIGEKKGLEKGLKKGIQKGIQETKIEFVKRMNEDGLNIEIIAKYVGLTVKEVMTLLSTS